MPRLRAERAQLDALASSWAPGEAGPQARTGQRARACARYLARLSRGQPVEFRFADRGDSPWTTVKPSPTACPHYSTACPPHADQAAGFQASTSASDKGENEASRAWMPGPRPPEAGRSQDGGGPAVGPPQSNSKAAKQDHKNRSNSKSLILLPPQAHRMSPARLIAGEPHEAHLR